MDRDKKIQKQNETETREEVTEEKQRDTAAQSNQRQRDNNIQSDKLLQRKKGKNFILCWKGYCHMQNFCCCCCFLDLGTL